jgi:hypothetical protein
MLGFKHKDFNKDHAHTRPGEGFEQITHNLYDHTHLMEEIMKSNEGITLKK